MNLDTKIATLMLSSGKNQQKFEIQATEIKPVLVRLQVFQTHDTSKLYLG